MVLGERPDLSNTIELQVWDVSEKKLLKQIPGACGLTTKECPFYLFLSESECGEYVASGSEDGNVYIYHVRHARLMRVLVGHTDVVSSMSWFGGGMLVSGGDDKAICVWSASPKAHDLMEAKTKRRRILH
jgi:WD40 repeat protein